MEMQRVNTRISKELNSWLDERSQKIGMPKSMLIMLAIEQYRKQEETYDLGKVMNEMVQIIKGEMEGTKDETD